MDAIKVCYPDLQNAGDALNRELIEKLSSKSVVRSKVYDADMIAIGGALYGAQYAKDTKRRFAQRLFHLLYGRKPLYVWGSGFWIGDNDNGFYRSNLVVCALRGEKTKRKLEKITAQNYDVPLADAGLLIDLFLEERPAVEYKMGVIPHYLQRNEKPFLDLSQQEGHCMIDITKSPREVIEQIAKCETIASSSLHGLIFADSLHISSLHLVGERDLKGGMFKFEDYYSAYGLTDSAWNIREALPGVEDIKARYQITPDAVELKKKQLLECFPKLG